MHPTTGSRVAAISKGLPALFACVCGISVANVYYAQPLLDALAADFRVSHAAIGGIITATQMGCALALVLLVPLGDRFGRRRLMLMQAPVLAVALAAVGWAPTPRWMLAGMLGVGMLGTAMTQGMIAYAAAASTAAERGHVLGIVQGGVVIGLLMARSLAGILADIAGWRTVYLFSAGMMLVLTVVLMRTLAAQPAATTRQSYFALLKSMASLLWRDRVLQIRGTIAMLMFAAFSAFWSALVLPLSAAPYTFSHTAIGAFGLVGVIGVLAASRAGRWADQGLGQRTSGVALLLLLISWLPLALTPHSLWMLVIGIVILDVAGQAIHVTNQSMIFSLDSQAHSRLVSCYMLFYAVGSGAGAITSTATYAVLGWTGECLLGAAISLSALVFWAATLRSMPKSARASPAMTTGGQGRPS